jgi:predicted phosphodiesterase
VGYHANPNECLELLERTGALSIAGNHDRAAAGVISPSSFGAVARHAINWTRRVLDPERALRLRALDVFDRLDETTCLVHAALHPEPNDQYHLSTPARVNASFAKLVFGEIDARLCFFGHTHQVAVHRSDGRTSTLMSLGPAPAGVELDDAYYLVNPGSVGQPRDGDERAAFAVFDDRARALEFRRVEYDRAACLRKAEAAGLLALPKRRLVRRVRRFFTH